jgi:hypothetical protein
MTTTFRAKNPASRAFGAVLTAAIVVLALTTSYVHLGLGGVLFTLNAIGYAGLAVLYVLGSAAPYSLIARFSWFPRLALAGYAALTIVAWAVQGPFFPLAYFTKGVEIALIGLIVVDVFRVYGGPVGLVRAAVQSVQWLFGGQEEMTASA